MKYRLFFLVVTLLLTVSQVAAQGTTEIVFFADEDSLTVYIPGNGQVVSLSDLAIESTFAGQTRSYRFEQYPALAISFDRVLTPLCLRLERDSVDRILPQACQGLQVFEQPIAAADIFWHRPGVGFLTLTITQGINVQGYCPAGQAECPLSYTPPTLTPVPPTATPPPTQTLAPAPEATPSPLATPAPDDPLEDLLLGATQTLEVVMAARAAADMTRAAQLTQTAVAVEIAGAQTEIAILDATATAAFVETEAAVARSLALEIARLGVNANAEWTPVVETFDGVEMVLVPAGCFMMGSNEGDNDEQPVHEQCFDEPFWIDRFEVTNAQYGSSGRWSDDDRPRETIDWSDAKTHCEGRGARLPTEAEWEYAARGPDSLVYPWGDDFVADNVVYVENSGGETAEVGTRPAGASWVGAHDMSGNVREWTSTIYDVEAFPYPYNSADGREDGNRLDVRRVLRGGSFVVTSYNLRSASRGRSYPDSGSTFGVGFRCARSS